MSATWMSNNLSRYASLPLEQVLLPGSHDAGMSRRTGGTPFSTNAVSLTQTRNIGDQLKLGIRVFYVRPVISNGEYVCGHYENLDNFEKYKNQALGVVGRIQGTLGSLPLPQIPSLNTWQGTNGQPINEVVNQVNEFTAQSNELVVLDLSGWGCWNTDNGNNNWTNFTKSEWEGLFNSLRKLQHLFSMPSGKSGHLKNIDVGDFLGNTAQPKPAVVCIIKDDGIQYLGSDNQKGFFPTSQWYGGSDTGGDFVVGLDKTKIVEQVVYDYMKMYVGAVDAAVNALGDVKIRVEVPGFGWFGDLVEVIFKMVANPLKAAWANVRDGFLGTNPSIANIIDEARKKRDPAMNNLYQSVTQNGLLSKFIVNADAIEDPSLCMACVKITETTLNNRAAPLKAKL